MQKDFANSSSICINHEALVGVSKVVLGCPPSVLPDGCSISSLQLWRFVAGSEDDEETNHDEGRKEVEQS